MGEKDNQRYFHDTIVINNIVSDNEEDVITLYTKDLRSQYLDKTSSYKVSPDGKILSNNLMSEQEENPKEISIERLIEYGFEKIPDNLTERELKNILRYSISNIKKDITFGKTEPFSVELDDNGDLKIVLLIFNGTTITLSLGKFPLKIKDANDKVVFAGLVDLNKEISSNKIGICCLKISKEILREEEIDLNTWTITFEAQ